MRVELRVDQYLELSPAVAWAAIVDWQGHSRWVPLTRVWVDDAGGDTGVGARFTARTGIGRLGFDDPMEVTEQRFDGRRGHVAVRKLGRVVTGEAAIGLSPFGAGVIVRWDERVELPWLAQWLEPVARRIGRAGVRRALRRMGRLAQSGSQGAHRLS